MIVEAPADCWCLPQSGVFLLLVGLTRVNAQPLVDSHDEAGNDSPSQKDMHLATAAYQQRMSQNPVVNGRENTQVELSEFLDPTILAYSINGSVINVTNTTANDYMPNSPTSTLEYTGLRLDTVTQVANNLGGYGPYNGGLNFLDPSWGAECADSTKAPADRNCRKDPNFIAFENVGMHNGRNVSMRIDNATVYEAANPAVNFFNGAPFQLNMRPIFELTAGMHANTHPEQPFTPEIALTNAGLDPASVPGTIALSTMRALLQLLDITYRAENSNLVSLYFQFYYTDDGSPATLDETMIAFYDFDQDHADYTRAYIR